MSKKDMPQDPLQPVSDTLRSKGGIEYRTAVVGQDRYEYVRGKDMATYLREKPDIWGKFVSGNKELEDRVKDFVELLIRRRYLMRCERLYKKPKPGKKRLAKWPRKLVNFPPAEQIWNEESFYVWLQERPTSPWTYVWSFVMVLVVIAMCCFQLAPYKVKLIVVYGSMALLCLMLGTIFVRGVVALFTWISTGRAFWIFPNMMSDDIPINQAFKPLYTYDKPEEGKGTHWALRLGVLAAVFSFCTMLYTVAPEKGEMRHNAKQAHDAILDWLITQPHMKSIAGSNGTETANQTVTAPPEKEAEPEEEPAAAKVLSLDELLNDLGEEFDEEDSSAESTTEGAKEGAGAGAGQKQQQQHDEM